ncbi:HAMP domain protein [Mycobacterium xenopi 4042]|uniref:HAMP domain protein n=1 Tax=Mycobacterium xenopi 4042 TaxID=1299334 RepID=X7ZWE5_MYCXE|nr:HAMP domain protein [Mycobacterium xenopi 4042]
MVWDMCCGSPDSDEPGSTANQHPVGEEYGDGAIPPTRAAAAGRPGGRHLGAGGVRAGRLGVAVTSILRHSLLNRADQTLLDASRSWVQAPRRISQLPYEGPNADRPPSKFYVRVIGLDGRSWQAINDSHAEPALPANNDVGPDPVTVGSVNGSNVQWRAVSVRGPLGRLITVAFDLSDVQHTLRSLIWLQVGIGAAVLLVLGIAGYAVVHRSLRPLVEVERTAAAIAAGQLDRRVPSVIREPKWADFRWRSTECSRKSSRRWQRRNPRRKRRALPRSACDASSPMPATSCAPR